MGSCCCTEESKEKQVVAHNKPSDSNGAENAFHETTTHVPSPEPSSPEPPKGTDSDANRQQPAANPLIVPSRRSSARSTTSEASPLAQSVRRLSSLRGLAVVNTTETEKLVSQIETAFTALVAAEQEQYENEVRDEPTEADAPDHHHEGYDAPPTEEDFAFSPRSTRSSSFLPPPDPQAVEEAAVALQKIVDESLALAEKFCSSVGEDPHMLTAHSCHSNGDAPSSCVGNVDDVADERRRSSSLESTSTAKKTLELVDVLNKSHLVSDSTNEKFAELHEQLSEVLQMIRPEAPSPRRSLDQIKSQSFRESKRISGVLESNREALEEIVAANASSDESASTASRLALLRGPMIAFYAELPEVTFLKVPLLATESEKVVVPTPLVALWKKTVLQDPRKRVVALIGPLGSGKSTFLRQLLREQWESWDSSSRPLPQFPAFHVDLRSFIGSPSAAYALKTLIRDAIEFRLGPLSPQNIADLQNERLLLLVDSYGEFVCSRRLPIMSSESKKRLGGSGDDDNDRGSPRRSADEAPWSLVSCTDLPEWPRVTIVLTARPEQMALRSDTELCAERGQLQSIKKLFILPLTKQQRLELATKFSELDAGKHHTGRWYEDRLQTTPGLSELSVNPLVLRLSLEALDDIVSAASSLTRTRRNVDLVDVLAAYTKKITTGKDGGDAAAACCKLASALFSAGLYACNKADDLLWSILTFQHDEKSLLVNPFLFHAGGTVCFRHDIFLEYFASLDDDNSFETSFLGRRQLSLTDGLLLHFFAHRARHDSAFLSFLFSLVDRSRGLFDDYDDENAIDEGRAGVLSANAISIITAAHKVLNRVDFSRVLAPGALLCGSCTFVKCDFSGADFSFSTIGTLQAVECKFDQVNLFGARHTTQSHFSLSSSSSRQEGGDGHRGAVTSLSISPSASVAASSSVDGSVCLWDVVSGFLIRRIESAHEGGVKGCLFDCRDERILLTWGISDSLVRLWFITSSISGGGVGGGSAPPIRAVRAFSAPPGSQIAVAIFDSNSNTVTARFSDSFSTMIWEAASSNVISGDVSKRASYGTTPRCVYEMARDGRVTAQFTHGKPLVRVERSSLDGELFITIVHAAAGGGENDKRIESACLSDDGSLLAVLVADHKKIGVKIYLLPVDADDGDTEARLMVEIGEGKGTSAVINPSKTKLATFGADDNIYLFDLDDCLSAAAGVAAVIPKITTRSLAFLLAGHQGIVSCARFASGDILLTGGIDQTIRCWNVDRGDLLWVHSGQEEGVTLAPLLVSCSFAGARLSAATMKHLGLKQQQQRRGEEAI